MSGHAFVFWMLLLAAFAGIAKAMQSLSESHRCLRCGGKGGHKDDCPWADD